MIASSRPTAGVAAPDLVDVYGSGGTAVCEPGGVTAEFTAASADVGIFVLRICTIEADLSARCVRTVLVTDPLQG
jgi:hypothetical protein